eukprot:jgi/Orpsp1_1/1174956/evm.model.c7180000052080.1
MKSILILSSLINIAYVFAASCNQPFAQCGGLLLKQLKLARLLLKLLPKLLPKPLNKPQKLLPKLLNQPQKLLLKLVKQRHQLQKHQLKKHQLKKHQQQKHQQQKQKLKLLKLQFLMQNSGFTGAGLKFKNAKNIIIQNLKFSYCLGSNKDCINAQKSTNVWVDHCEFFNDRNHGKDYYDGLVDFTHASDYITISWNYIHDHYKASLIGHSDTNASEDSGKLHITYHHNYFKNVGSRLPSLRFGTGHIYNNVYENIESSSVNIRMGAKALVEGNVFRSANKPISTNLDSSQEGSVIQRNNDFGSTASTNSITKTDGLSSVPYKYSADSVSSVYNAVVKSAGPQ